MLFRSVRNKKTLEKQRLMDELRVSCASPIEFFDSILKNPDAPMQLRFMAAQEMAPYLHPKLSSIEARQGMTSHEERLKQYKQMLADSASSGSLLPPPQGGDRKPGEG